jgi:hypothetical protein
VEARISQLANVALETVAGAVESGDVRAALAVLKGLGALSGTRPAVGSDDARELSEEAELSARERASARELRRLIAL